MGFKNNKKILSPIFKTLYQKNVTFDFLSNQLFSIFKRLVDKIWL